MRGKGSEGTGGIEEREGLRCAPPSLGEVSVDRSRVGPGLRSPRWADAGTPVHVHRRKQARSCIVRVHNKRERVAARCIAASLLSRMHSVRARARARVLRECAWLLATRSRFRSVFARRGASPSVAASRPAKILARSVCSFASFPLSLAPRSSGAPVLPLSTASRPFATARVPFSPFQSLRRKVPSLASPRPVPPTGGDPALRLHRRYCGREDFDEERREFLKRLKK